MRKETIHFEVIKRYAKKDGVCPVCKKRVQRSLKFQETVNPYNRNEDGTIKTKFEVIASVAAKAKAWEPDFTHERCKGQA